jgi:glycosyltransferase involved in cell wall biosynthesis
LKAIFEQFPQTKMIVGGDMEIYNRFWYLPETRKLYLPYTPYDLYPYTLSRMDLMLVPLSNNKFNRAKSDIKLVEAGRLGIPWIASKTPVYQAWGTGGILVDGVNAWYPAIQHMLEATPDELESMAAAGKEQAIRERSSQVLTQLWLDKTSGVVQ